MVQAHPLLPIPYQRPALGRPGIPLRRDGEWMGGGSAGSGSGDKGGFGNGSRDACGNEKVGAVEELVDRARSAQVRHEDGGAVKVGEGCPEPLPVRDVATLHDEPEPHDVAYEASGDQSRAEVVADLGASSDERFFLGNALPLGGEDEHPHFARIVSE